MHDIDDLNDISTRLHACIKAIVALLPVYFVEEVTSVSGAKVRDTTQ